MNNVVIAFGGFLTIFFITVFGSIWLETVINPNHAFTVCITVLILAFVWLYYFLTKAFEEV